jgi:hypothetical protein
MAVTTDFEACRLRKASIEVQIVSTSNPSIISAAQLTTWSNQIIHGDAPRVHDTVGHPLVDGDLDLPQPAVSNTFSRCAIW